MDMLGIWCTVSGNSALLHQSCSSPRTSALNRTTDTTVSEAELRWERRDGLPEPWGRAGGAPGTDR